MSWLKCIQKIIDSGGDDDGDGSNRIGVDYDWYKGIDGYDNDN